MHFQDDDCIAIIHYSLLFLHNNKSFMRKTKSTLYFEKRYCLLVHSLVLTQRVSLTGFSKFSSQQQVIDRNCTYSINQIVYLNCIDVVQDNVTTYDNNPQLHFTSLGDRKFNKNEIGSVKFDLNNQKVVKPESSLMFSKELDGGKGVINYKFINLKTKSISSEEFDTNKIRKSQITMDFSKDQHQIKIDQLMQLLKDKDELINKLQTKIDSLIVEGKKRSQSKEPNQRDTSKDKQISLHIKVSAANQKMKRENQRLMTALREQSQKVDELEEQIDVLGQEKENLERQINMIKKQSQKGATSEMGKSKLRGRSVSYVGPPFLKQSSVAVDQYPMQQSIADWGESFNTKINVVQPKGRQSMVQDSDNSRISAQNQQSILNAASQPSQQSLPRKSIINAVESGVNQTHHYPYRASTFGGNFPQLPTAVTNKSVIEPSRGKGSPRQDLPLNSGIMGGYPEQDSLPEIIESERKDQVQLEKRISMQKQDLKWTSVIFDRNEEIDILKKKLQLKAGEVKALEKELEKSKVMIKKKEVEIKQLRKQSKKNLLFGGESSSDLNIVRNRAQFQLQFEKMQAENDRQKNRLQQEIQFKDHDIEEKVKQIKKLRLNLQQSQSHQKTYQQKYQELKVFTQKNTQEYIQYKEKAQQYDLMLTKTKEMETLVKTLDANILNLNNDNKKLEGQVTKSTARWNQRDREWEKLKRVQREHQYLRSVNQSLKQSIQSYETRYIELKKYCIKIQSAYNKFVMASKKRSTHQSNIIQEKKDDKQMQQRFSELSKKVNDCELNYYKQQIQDLAEEKTFVSLYFDRKLREEKDRIADLKDYNEEEKKDMTFQKQKQIQKAITQKMQELQIKTTKLQRLYEEVSDRINGEGKDSFVMSIAQKMRVIEKKLSMIMDREGEREVDRKNMKETIMQISQQLKTKSFKPSGSAAELQRNSSQNLALMNMFNENRQKLSMLEQARQRSEQSQQRTYQQNRKMNANLLRENGQLKMKNQKLQMEFQKVERKGVEREKNLQQQFKKADYEYKIKIQKLSEQIEKQTVEMAALKDKLADSQAGVASLEGELLVLSEELDVKNENIHDLQKKIVRFEERIQEYEDGERKILQQVGEIKRNSEQNQAELVHLIEERSNNFLKIEKTKDVENEKLKKIIQELQMKIEAQMFQNIQNRQKIQTMKSTIEALDSTSQQKIQQMQLTIDNKEKQYDDAYLQVYQTNKENQILQSSLMEMSNQISSKEVQYAELIYQFNSVSKQLEVYRNQSNEYATMEKKIKSQNKDLQSLLDDKVTQMKFFEERMVKFQQQVGVSAKQMERVSLLNLKYENDLKEAQERYMSRQQEIIQIKQHNSMLQIQFKKQELYFMSVQKMNDQYKERVEQLETEIQKLNQANKQLNDQNSNNLKVSRKKTLADVTLEPLSPGRKKLSKKASNLEVPESSYFGTGGITPIQPVSPHLITKKMENPFEPRAQQLNNTRLQKLTSIDQRNNQNQSCIAIHIEQPHEEGSSPKLPPPLLIKKISPKDIDIVQDQNVRNTQQPVNFFKGMIMEEEHHQNMEGSDSQQENTMNFGKNMHLGDSNNSDEERVEQYISQINQLKREVMIRDEENQKLNNQIMELERHIEQLTHQLQQKVSLPINNPRESQERYGSLNASRWKSSNDNPPPNKYEAVKIEVADQREIQSEKNDDRVHRSIIGAGNINSSRQYQKPANSANFDNLQQKYQAAELDNQYLNDNLNQLKTQLDEQVKNNEKLIEQAEFCRQAIQQLEERLQESNFQIQQYKKFQIFQQMYKSQLNVQKELKMKLEELHLQCFQNDNKLSSLIHENTELMQTLNAYKNQTNDSQQQRNNLINKIQQLNANITNMKIQYRKYEEDAELEIVHLKEIIDAYKQSLHAKEQEIIVLGQHYVDMEIQIASYESDMANLRKNLQKRDANNNQAANRCSQLEEELNKTESSRQNMFKTIKQLENQIKGKNELMSNNSNDVSLTIKKYQIKIQANKQELQQSNDRVAEKEKVINLLKGEIGLYNEQCDQLKKCNDQLTFELTKVERELKDIMQVYEKEIQGFKAQIQIKDDHISKITQLLKDKQSQFNLIFKQTRAADKQKDDIKSQYVDLMTSMDKLKQSKARQYNQIYTQLQLKINDYEKLKTILEKLNQEASLKEETHRQVCQKYQNRLKGYKEKLQRYQQMIQQFQKQFAKIGQRPTNELHEEVIFQNQILRNRVDQLQELAGRQDHKQKQQQVYLQFRKYKANKQRQIQDLQSQMEKYGIKINQLEENVYFLKKENQSITRENYRIAEAKQEILNQCQDLRESYNQLESQLKFYKNRKIFDMQKLLNQTNEEKY